MVVYIAHEYTGGKLKDAWRIKVHHISTIWLYLAFLNKFCVNASTDQIKRGQGQWYLFVALEMGPANAALQSHAYSKCAYCTHTVQQGSASEFGIGPRGH